MSNYKRLQKQVDDITISFLTSKDRLVLNSMSNPMLATEIKLTMHLYNSGKLDIDKNMSMLISSLEQAKWLDRIDDIIQDNRLMNQVFLTFCYGQTSELSMTIKSCKDIESAVCQITPSNNLELINNGIDPVSLMLSKLLLQLTSMMFEKCLEA